MSARMTHSIISCRACTLAMPRRDCMNAASSCSCVSCVMSALFGVGCVGASIVAKDGAGTNFSQHPPFNRRPVAECLVSSLSHGSPRFASVAFAGCAQVLGLFIHRASVAKHSLFIYGESSSEVDIWN